MPEMAPLPPARRSTRSRVLLGIADLGFHQEVLDYLGRDPRVEVAAAISEPARVVAAMAATDPDLVLACPIIARELRHAAAELRYPITVVAEQLTVPVLREAVAVGAGSVFAWPEERERLAEAVAEAAGRSAAPGHRGRVIAVTGARGGAGATFVATHLAAAYADRGASCVLVDLDLEFAGLSAALGVGWSDPVRTLSDLVPVAAELGPEHVRDAVLAHPRGFGILLAPRAEPDGPSAEVTPGLCVASVALLAGDVDVIILHLPRTVDALTRAAIRMADQTLVVTTLDLFSLYGARRTVAAFGLDLAGGRGSVVVNEPGRSSLGIGEVERVLGARPFAAIHSDPSVRRAQERCQLLPAGHRRAGRDVRRLAESLHADAMLAEGAAR
jgi:Flp pilus assembly CpaE family ATPase